MNGASRGFFLVSLFIFSACISITPLNSNLNNLGSSDSLDDIRLKPAASSSELNENSTQSQDSNGNFSDACLNNDAEPCISPSKWHFERMLNDGDIKEVNIYKNAYAVEVILHREVLNKDKHIANSFGTRILNGPHYRLEYGNLELFVDKLKNAEERGIEFKYTF